MLTKLFGYSLIVVTVILCITANSFAGSQFDYPLAPLSALEKDEAQALVEDLSTLKADFKEFYKQIETISKKRPVRVSEVDSYASLIYDYLLIRRSIVRYLKPYDFLTLNTTRFEINRRNPTILEERFEQNESGPATPVYYLRLNPEDALGKQAINTIKIGLALSLNLFDVYSEMIEPMIDNKKLRRLIELDHELSFRRLQTIQSGFVNHVDRFGLERIVKFYKKIKLKGEKTSTLTDDLWLTPAIEATDSYKILINGDYSNFKNIMQVPVRGVRDALSAGIKSFTYNASELFGNFTGRFQFRKGKLYDMDKESQKALASKLQPLDILIERTPFRLTDKFIPGYYGHVAFWLGTEEQLKGLGIWDHPMMLRYQKAISSGKSIIESVRNPGVRLSRLDQFLDIDDLLILRRKNLDPELMHDYVLSAIDLIGRPYDFNFDVETSDEIICSEVVYHVFNDMNWPIDKVIGRYTVSPDQVAYRALNINGGKDFDIVEMIKDGTSVVDKQREKTLLINISKQN